MFGDEGEEGSVCCVGFGKGRLGGRLGGWWYLGEDKGVGERGGRWGVRVWEIEDEVGGGRGGGGGR